MSNPERETDGAWARLASGASWAEFCDTLKLAGLVLQRDEVPRDPLILAEGHRHLARLLRAGLLAFLENHDPTQPSFFRVVDETVKLGADNPDNLYLHACISGAHRYRIRGRRGSVKLLTFSTQRGGYGEGAGLPPSGQLAGKDLTLGPDGELEITVSVDRAPGNWLPMAPDSGHLIVRQTFGDKAREVAAELAIERIAGPGEPFESAPLTAEHVDAGLARAARFVGGAAATFANLVAGFAARQNELPRFDQELSNQLGGDPNIAYYHGYFDLADDEALLVTLRPPRSAYYNFQLGNHFMESLDYRSQPASKNGEDLVAEADGRVEIVVAARDPGAKNFLSTQGHRRGTMCLRWVHAESHPDPEVRVVSLHDLTERPR